MAIALQSHMHVSTTLSDVTNGTLLSSFKVIADGGWEESPEIFATVVRSQSSSLRVWLSKNAGNVVKLINYRYIVVLQPEHGEDLYERWARIRALHGETVYLHDIHHDESNHATGYKTMYCEMVGSFKGETGPGIPKGYIEIILKDKSL